MLNVVCVVPVSAYEVGLSVFSGTIDVFVVVPSAAVVIVDDSAIIKGNFQGRNMHITIQTTMNSVNVYTSLTLFSFSRVLNVCYQITRKKHIVRVTYRRNEKIAIYNRKGDKN